MPCSRTKVLLYRDSWYNVLASLVMNFSGFLGRGGGAYKLQSVLFLFSETVFFRAIEKERGWLGNTESLKGRNGQIAYEVKKMTVSFYLYCPRIGCLCSLCLNEA